MEGWNFYHIIFKSFCNYFTLPPPYVNLQKKKRNSAHPWFRYTIAVNWVRVSTNVGHALSRHDTNNTRNINLTHTVSFSNSIYSVSIDFRKKYVLTFFVENLISYIFCSNYFSVSSLGTKLSKVIGKNPVFEPLTHAAKKGFRSH